MRLSEKDKNAILKAALQAEDLSHFESLKRWVVSIVETMDEAEAVSGKSDVNVPVPSYIKPETDGRQESRIAPVANPHGRGMRHRWEDDGPEGVLLA